MAQSTEPSNLLQDKLFTSARVEETKMKDRDFEFLFLSSQEITSALPFSPLAAINLATFAV